MLIEGFFPRDVKARNKIGSKESSNRFCKGNLTRSVWHVAKFRLNFGKVTPYLIE